MEESEKRRERLKAMRQEAAQEGTQDEAENSTGLANPLVESQTAQPGVIESYSRPRFDFYTDPMAAYSADKRKSIHSPQVSQPYSTPPRPGYSDSPAYHAQGSYFLDQRPQAHGVQHTFSPLGSPMQSGLPGTLPENPPNVWGSPGGMHTSNFPPNYPRFSNFANHRYGRGSPGFDHGRGSPGFDQRQGRGYIYSTSPRPYSGRARSPYQDSGRGRGRWQGNNVSSSSMQSGRRGSGNREYPSAEARPDLYYNKCMIEDPWEQLQPIIWKKVNIPSKDLDTPDSSKSWLPNSIRMKKARLAEGQVKSSSQQSLAKYLAVNIPSKDLDTPDSHKSWLPNSIRMNKARLAEGQVKSSSQQSLAEYLAASFNEAEAVSEGVDDESSA